MLNIVKGYKIEFFNIHWQSNEHRENAFSDTEHGTIQAEIAKLLAKKVIVPSQDEPNQFVSNIFVRPKRNGKFRMILNLSHLNKFITYKHFRMDTLNSCLNLMSQGCFLASIDLTDAYYSVYIHEDSQKFLKFRFQGQLYKFVAMPNGLASAPRNFTLLLKPALANLRMQGPISCGYLDDIFLVGNSYQQCYTYIQETKILLKKLDFHLNEEKSVLEPVQSIEHLGFVINSQDMSVTLSEDKFSKIKNLATPFLKKKNITIRSTAQLVGTLVAALPGVTYGQLYYRQLENDKSIALKKSKGNFDHFTLSSVSLSHIHWWLSECIKYKKPIILRPPTIILQTDASNSGWGAYHVGQQTTGGQWADSDLFQHINFLELKASFLGLQALCCDVNNAHILLQLDNVTAVSYIRNMGGCQSLCCNNLAVEIWQWCIARNIWISATHIAGVTNIKADTASRKFNRNTEWQLDPVVFSDIVKQFGSPCIDLFASRINKQMMPFVSWRPDPDACAVYAFSLNWNSYKLVYLFPPFSLLGKVLQKIQTDRVPAILIAPDWPSQTWYPLLLRLLKRDPIKLKGRSLLHLPSDPQAVHPLYPKLKMLACYL